MDKLPSAAAVTVLALADRHVDQGYRHRDGLHTHRSCGCGSGKIPIPGNLYFTIQTKLNVIVNAESSVEKKNVVYCAQYDGDKIFIAMVTNSLYYEIQCF